MQGEAAYVPDEERSLVILAEPAPERVPDVLWALTRNGIYSRVMVVRDAFVLRELLAATAPSLVLVSAHLPGARALFALPHPWLAGAPVIVLPERVTPETLAEELSGHRRRPASARS